MKAKVLNALTLLFSTLAYLEWGTEQSSHLFQMEWDIITKIVSDPLSVLHPFIIFPLFGQILLLYSLFQKTPGRKLSIVAILLLALLVVLIFAIGLMEMNLKIIGFSLPFIITGGYTFWYHFKNKKPVHSTV